jgi:hypothetical protein
MPYFVLRKKSRWERNIRPYQGWTCSVAGITPGQIYTDKELAEADAQKLSKANPVGFDVVPVKLQEIEQETAI